MIAPPIGDPWTRPEDLREYIAWQDAWLSRLMDDAVERSAGDERVFRMMAIVYLAGFLAGYDG